MAEKKSIKQMTIKELQITIAEAAARDEADKDWVASFVKAQVAADIRRAIRDTPGMDQSKLASLMGCTKQYISQILNETTNFTMETLAAISAVLHRHLVVRMLADDEAMPVIAVDKLDDVRKAASQEFKIAQGHPLPKPFTAYHATPSMPSLVNPRLTQGKEKKYGKVHQETAGQDRYIPQSTSGH